MAVAVIDERLSGWVTSVLGDGADEVRGLRHGGAPWLIRFGERGFVLRPIADDATLQIERKGLLLAAAHGVPVPETIGVFHDPPAILSEQAAGSTSIPRELPSARLRALGALAARLHTIPVPFGLGLPDRERPIETVDFAALRGDVAPDSLIARAEVLVRRRRPWTADGFVHGDLWQGNVSWADDEVCAVFDWDCAGIGPAGIDLGSARCDAALCFGVEAADEVLAGWQQHADRAADDIAYWDVVAALSTPPDIDWFAVAIAAQGRGDLTHEVLLERRDEFLAAALAALGG